MDAKKMNETTLVTEDNNTDSGIVSGPIDYLPGDSEDLSSFAADKIMEKYDEDTKDIKVPSVSVEQGDSGVVCLSEMLTSMDLSEEIASVQCEQSRTPEDLSIAALLYQQDEDGDTPLHIAVVHGCEKTVGILIRICPNKDWLNVPNDYGHTALHLAVMSRNAMVTRMLVRAGASLAVRDRKGETPLHKATLLSDIDCINALLGSLPENPQEKMTLVVEQKNYNGQACVHLAASAGHIEILRTLVHYNADINSRENLAGWSALHIGAHRGDARLVRYLRERCSVDVRARDYAGRTPRRLARWNPAREAFANMPDDSETDSDSEDDDDYDSSDESTFERMCEMSAANAIHVI